MREKDRRTRKRASTRRKRLNRGKSGLPASGKTMPTPEKAQSNSDLERLHALMFGTSGDVEQEYNEYQDYWGVDPRNRH